uniref:Uncharacterized protein n=1 Tax=Anguilla anguilla TaxID=7936 RepID=A0A0E9RYT0_ANGAN
MFRSTITITDSVWQQPI